MSAASALTELTDPFPQPQDTNGVGCYLHGVSPYIGPRLVKVVGRGPG